MTWKRTSAEYPGSMWIGSGFGTIHGTSAVRIPVSAAVPRLRNVTEPTESDPGKPLTSTLLVNASATAFPPVDGAESRTIVTYVPWDTPSPSGETEPY